LGRFRLSLLYSAISIFILAGIGSAIVLGLISPAWFQRVSLETASYAFSMPLAGVALFHAFKLNKQSPFRPLYSRWFIALPAYAVLVLAVALVIRTFVFQPFNAPSASSFPNLMVGDMFLVSKTAYRNADPQRGDIAVFKLPNDPSVDYVKRVIGLPGDRVQMKQGRLFLNGVLVPREAVICQFPVEQPDESGAKFYRETLPSGRSYVIAERGDVGDADNTDEYAVPVGHYFALGDNRDNSQDSRFLQQVGYIPRANFIGPFVVRFWNTNGVPLRGRPAETSATQ
jgi:signal peptidase I